VNGDEFYAPSVVEKIETIPFLKQLSAQVGQVFG
jgi:hypothetical protein